MLIIAVALIEISFSDNSFIKDKLSGFPLGPWIVNLITILGAQEENSIACSLAKPRSSDNTSIDTGYGLTKLAILILVFLMLESQTV